MFRASRIVVLLAAVLTGVLGDVVPAHASVTLDDGHVDGAWIK